MSKVPKQLEFYGREDEILWLRNTFEKAMERGPDGAYLGPQMAILLAETGLGKSRLVQQLYIELAKDPKWNHPETAYWPTTFGDGGVNITVNPEMKGCSPKGPPRFIWLGARWSPTEERNPLSRRSALPELGFSIAAHSSIITSRLSVWKDAAARLRKAIKIEGVDDSLGMVADYFSIPFFGLVLKLAKGADALYADRSGGAASYERIELEQQRTELEAVLESMEPLLEGLPTVLWLDDAQWIDSNSLRFLDRLWESAKKRRSPLLIVVTHWEREWRELAHQERDGNAGLTLHDFLGHKETNVQTRVLCSAPEKPLREYLHARLPGLTEAQRSLLIGKAGGNFLTMSENIGTLLRHPKNFEDLNPQNALSKEGEAKAEVWESTRERRVLQRFEDLEHEIQDLLGWSSQLGQRFLRDVVVRAAHEVAMMSESKSNSLIDRCEDPYVILGKAGEETREFRDRAFHSIASRHFEAYSSEHKQIRSCVRDECIVSWINNSFDESGNPIWPDTSKGISPPLRSATGLGNEDRHELIRMSIRHLPVPREVDWSNPKHLAALRTIYLWDPHDDYSPEWIEWAKASIRLISRFGWRGLTPPFSGKRMEKLGISIDARMNTWIHMKSSSLAAQDLAEIHKAKLDFYAAFGHVNAQWGSTVQIDASLEVQMKHVGKSFGLCAEITRFSLDALDFRINSGRYAGNHEALHVEAIDEYKRLLGILEEHCPSELQPILESTIRLHRYSRFSSKLAHGIALSEAKAIEAFDECCFLLTRFLFESIPPIEPAGQDGSPSSNLSTMRTILLKACMHMLEIACLHRRRLHPAVVNQIELLCRQGLDANADEELAALETVIGSIRTSILAGTYADLAGDTSSAKRLQVQLEEYFAVSKERYPGSLDIMVSEADFHVFRLDREFNERNIASDNAVQTVDLLLTYSQLTEDAKRCALQEPSKFLHQIVTICRAHIQDKEARREKLEEAARIYMEAGDRIQSLIEAHMD